MPDGSTQRIPSVPREQLDEAMQDAIRGAFREPVASRFLSDGDDALPIPSAIGSMLHHPKLAREWLRFNNVLLWSPTVPERQRELMILRLAWRTRSDYEWVQHVHLSERYGVTRDEVDAVIRGDYAGFDGVERDLLVATDELLDDYRVGDATWARLAERFDEKELVELVFVVGTYTCLAMVFKSFGLSLAELDTEGVPLPSQ
jgi:alkylhydroperoxidase family enzyme